MPVRSADLTGERFGNLVVVEQASAEPRTNRVLWRCKCDCGQYTIQRPYSLRSGKSHSCGCMRRSHAVRHGGSSTAEYSSWKAMHLRCNNPGHHAYPHYGGRGIVIAPSWASFEQFYRDMGPRPAGTTIDRIDNDGNYEPGNCRWATPGVQRTNQRPRSGERRGSDQGRFAAKLTPESVREIRALYSAGGGTYAELGKRFGVDKRAIGRVVQRKSWRHVS